MPSAYHIIPSCIVLPTPLQMEWKGIAIAPPPPIIHSPLSALPAVHCTIIRNHFPIACILLSILLHTLYVYILQFNYIHTCRREWHTDRALTYTHQFMADTHIYFHPWLTIMIHFTGGSQNQLDIIYHKPLPTTILE